jgi:hypothetical protein
MQTIGDGKIKEYNSIEESLYLSEIKEKSFLKKCTTNTML